MFVAPEPLHPSATGPARRALKLAEVVAGHCAVTLAAPAPSVFPDGPLRTVETGPANDQRLADAVAGHDVAVVQTLPSPRQLLAIRRSVPRLVVDLIAPLALEAWEAADRSSRRAVVRWRVREMLAHLALADLVLCTNERQRDLLVGAALGGGLLVPGGDEQLHDRIAVVSHGIDPEPPRRRGPGLRAGGDVGEDDTVAVWGGGIWSWLDPFTALRAMERARATRPDLKLAFVGFEHPDPAMREPHASLAAETVAYVRDRGLEDAVVFRPRWLSRAEYVDHLLDADAGLSLHTATLEGRYASRTRVVDYLYAGLPVVCTDGDTMSGVVAAHGLGRVVGPEDDAAVAAALDALTAAPRARDDRRALEPLLWPNVARPLVEFCLDERGADGRSRGDALVAARGYPALLAATLRAEGAAGIAGAARRRARGLVRRR